MYISEGRLIGRWIISNEEGKNLCVIDWDSSEITDMSGISISVSTTHLAVIRYLISYGHAVKSGEQIYRAVYDRDPDFYGIDTQNRAKDLISQIRRKYKILAECIKTHRGRGWSFLGNIYPEEGNSSFSNSIYENSDSSGCNNDSEAILDFKETTVTPEYRGFITKVFERYYGSEILTKIEGVPFWALTYTIAGIPYRAGRLITDLDKALCPLSQLNTNCDESGFFKASNHQSYTGLPLFEEYHHIVKDCIHFPDRPGYMLDEIVLDESGKVKSVSAHVGTYAENVYSSHILEYEIYLAYLKFKDKNLDDPDIWEELYKDLKIRNNIHRGVGRLGDNLFLEKMKKSLTSGHGRDALIGLQMLVLIKSNRNQKYRVLIGQRSNTTAMVSGLYEIPPAGGYEVLGDNEDGIYEENQDIIENFSPGCAIFREYLEELFNKSEFDGTGNGGITDLLLNDPRIQKVESLIQSGQAIFQFLGCSIDLLLLRPNLDFVLIINDEDYSRTQFITNEEYKKGRLLNGITVNNFDHEDHHYIWETHHGPSAGLWYLFKKTDLYHKLINEKPIPASINCSTRV